jgi:phosphate starvation-inducible PhoH-like protein
MIRGRTFKNAWMIFDEAQNSSVSQMMAVLTRLGDGTKMVITGDLNQRDKKFATNNGFEDFLARLGKNKSNLIKTVNFLGKDVQRSDAVREVLKLYNQD